MYVCDVCFWRIWGVIYVSKSQKGCSLIRWHWLIRCDVCLRCVFLEYVGCDVCFWKPKGLHSDTLTLIDVWGRETESERVCVIYHETHSVAVCCRVLEGVAVCCSVLQCVAVWCRVLQCVAVCCSVCGVWCMFVRVKRAAPWYRVAKTHRSLISVGHSAKQPYN